MSISVHINDKTNFKSKNAIVRFKDDIKQKVLIDDINNVDPSKYLNDGFQVTIDYNKKDNTVKVNIIKQEEFNKLEKRKELKARLRDAKYKRSGKPKQKLSSLKRSIPDNIFKAYTNIIRKYNFDIPSPDTVINNLDKHKLQVSMLMNTTHKISNDQDADNKVKKYFKLLGDFLGLEPIQLPAQPPEQNSDLQLNHTNQNNSDTEDEDEPKLVEVN
uniref:Uncharacterized protein n=1 Tax=viral metagenome TaxID=1070528 RepID=A0A6C0J867_9ZZZZ